MDEIAIALSAIATTLSIIIIIILLSRSKDSSKRELDNVTKDIKESIDVTSRVSTENVRGMFVGFNELLKVQADNQRAGIEITDKRIEALTKTVHDTLSAFREEMRKTLVEIRTENTVQLDKMRQTVDEKLNDTLNKRFNESIKVIHDSINSISQELGKMQTLATGVNDLKNVLTNVKTRGTWGEISLGNILEQILNHDQYKKSFKINPLKDDMVDYAVVLPGKDSEVYLPIDSKFPMEDYHRLVEASEKGNVTDVDSAQKALVRRIKVEARSICEKYICPPSSTDFAVMFLPTEGLYSEVLRTAGLAESLQNDYKVVVAGPTTVTALLNSLQMGFRSVAIEKRSAEVMKLLGVFKKEFSTFNAIIEKTQKNMERLTNDIGDITRRSNIIQRKLRSIEAPENIDDINALIGDDGDVQ